MKQGTCLSAVLTLPLLVAWKRLGQIAFQMAASASFTHVYTYFCFEGAIMILITQFSDMLCLRRALQDTLLVWSHHN